MHRVVVDVIHRRPKVRVIPHVALRRAAPHLTPARVLLAIPLE